jgi:signal transduction histidine kinase
MTESEPHKADWASGKTHTGQQQFQWLAHELHDGLLQWVIGARMQVESALAKLDQESPAAANLRQAVAHMLNALAEGRTLIGFLENQEIGECDVVKEITLFIETVRSFAAHRGQALRIELPSPNWPSLPKQHAWSLLRFVQQAVQNAIQHAGPTTIAVQLGWATCAPEPMLFASVEDHGVGFDPKHEVAEGHFGLQSLQQRVRMCGGRFELVASPGKGCRVTAILPPVKGRESLPGGDC